METGKPFIVRLVFRILAGDSVVSGVFEEQLRLVFANTIEAATEKARDLGIAENVTLPHLEKGFVKWEFSGILDIGPVQELSNGLLLDSVTRETTDPSGFLKYLAYRESLQNEASEPVG